MYTLKLNDITKDEVEFLYELSTINYAEYRDTQYRSLTDFLNQHSDNGVSKEKIDSFLIRNHNGTFFLLDVLFKYGFIEMHEDAWHFTVVITDLGRVFLEQNLIFVSTRRCVKCKKDYVNHLCSCGEQDNYEHYKQIIHKD